MHGGWKFSRGVQLPNPLTPRQLALWLLSPDGSTFMRVKWHHGRHLETVTSNRKSDEVNRCVYIVTWSTILSNFIPIRLKTTEPYRSDTRSSILYMKLYQKLALHRAAFYSVKLMLRSFGLVNSCSSYSQVRKPSQNIPVNSRSRDHKSSTGEKLSSSSSYSWIRVIYFRWTRVHDPKETKHKFQVQVSWACDTPIIGVIHAQGPPLGFLKRLAPQNSNNNNKMSSDMGSVLFLIQKVQKHANIQANHYSATADELVYA